MKKLLLLTLLIGLFVNFNHVNAKPAAEQSDKEVIDEYYFDVDLKGLKALHFFSEFPFYNKKGQITLLGKAFLSVLTANVWTWSSEPRIYVKEDVAYVHVVVQDGLNILYTLKKENGDWKVVKTQTKKLPTVGSKVVLENAFLRAIGPEILNATKTYYGETRLFYDERIIDITRNIRDDYYNITVQITTFEGAHDLPFGFDTITLRIPGFDVLKYEHKDVSNIHKIPLIGN